MSMWSVQMAHLVATVERPTSFARQTARIAFAFDCFKNLLKKTEVVVQTNTITIQTKCKGLSR